MLRLPAAMQSVATAMRCRFQLMRSINVPAGVCTSKVAAPAIETVRPIMPGCQCSELNR